MQKIDIKSYIHSEEKLRKADENPEANKVFIETYGCQMNVADSQTVTAVLLENGYSITDSPESADVIFINTCSIREKAEKTVRNRLQFFNFLKKSKPNLIVGILGCMAERLKEKLLEEEKVVDIIAGPDAYRTLPNLLKEAENGRDAVNVLLSRDENYGDISPVRKDKHKVSAFVSITRGCDNVCAFCVVPYTRGTERSRGSETIIREISEIVAEGYKEVTLLGQNVDKYYRKEEDLNFAGLLDYVAAQFPKIRIRFATSYPQNFTDEVLHTMAKHENICKYIHLPVQSGSSAILEKMRRGYDREFYLDRIKAIKEILPGCAISTDIITGYCSETDQDHEDTLSLMKEVGYDYAYMFKYSERPNTLASKKYKDDVPEDIKQKRLQEIISLQQELSFKSNNSDIGKSFEVLAEGYSKKSEDYLFGRNSQNKVIVFPKRNVSPGEHAQVIVTECTSATLLGHVLRDKLD
ncbi:MAG: tRNA (N6-isopentenyl adenosine(37)-C2)-methylthiotransferase MiaB [Bacteroidota bacterium]|nr:tRNA (N6-isopentenyl adenosine(37)-C2)-methylthiotransferase MiaB [Bacteroidota bacterium]